MSELQLARKHSQHISNIHSAVRLSFHSTLHTTSQVMRSAIALKFIMRIILSRASDCLLSRPNIRMPSSSTGSSRQADRQATRSERSASSAGVRTNQQDIIAITASANSIYSYLELTSECGCVQSALNIKATDCRTTASGCCFCCCCCHLHRQHNGSA